MRIALCLALIALGTTGGEVSITYAMKQVGEVESFAFRYLVTFLKRAVRNPRFWLGIGLLALNFFAMLTLLSWENVSFVIPAAALSYVTGGLAARLVLGEQLGVLRWAGIVVVTAGVAVVTFGG